MRRSKDTLIIGCGRLGASLASKLYDSGNNVMVIDKNQDSFKKLPSSYGGLAICIDATDLNALDDVNANEYSVGIVCTDRDTLNIMISEILKEEFKINKIIARLTDPDRRYVYDSLGIDIISPALLAIDEIDRILKEENNA